MRTRDENKETAIKEKAIEMIVREGFDGLSMQKLAKAARVSPATIYIYFKDREDLIHQIVNEEAKKMFEATLKGFDPQMSFAEGLKVQWRNRASYSINNPLRLQFIEQIRYTPVYEKAFKVDEKFLEAMKIFVTKAIDNKELVPLPIEIYWSIAFAPLYQLVRYHLSPRVMPGMPEKFELTEEKIEEALQLVLKALKP